MRWLGLCLAKSDPVTVNSIQPEPKSNHIMNYPRTIPAGLGAVAAIVLALTEVSSTQAAVIATTDAGTIAAFQSGATIESFDDLSALLITSYGAGQTVGAGQQFSTRNGATQPTFHSGGASPNDPVGNPGTPIGIFEPSGGIAGNVASPANVAGPLVINSTEAFNFAVMEVIFPSQASKVGFWLTSGSVLFQLRDASGNPLTTGDFEVTGTAGQFIGLTRGSADVTVAALVGLTEAFTIDDFTYATGGATSVPEPTSLLGGLLSCGLAGTFFALAKRRKHSDRT
jgi:hypothetical protein